ncbi:DUF4123 domain-containing protein [Massilia sp. BSC265]|uniref:DUF4123 domain-containing protein n=1 Tax=Massilia sp. BSC265 TaxID=1549812 RepID=UPI0009DD29E4|nr:DUF4123 domain-containing protein [Massilia sp. BSC265]
MSTSIDFRAIAEESLSDLPASNLYFLIDHGGLPGLVSKLSRSSLAWVSLFDCGRESQALEVAPLLVLAGSNGKLRMPRNLFDWIGKEGTYTSSVIMLSSPLRLEVMARRLAIRLDVKLSNDLDAMLRFFDPRILEGLIKVLPAEKLRSFLSVAESWQFPDRNGNMVKIDSNFSVEDGRFIPLELTQEQEFRLVDLSEADQVLDVIRSNFSYLENSHSFSLQYDFVRRQVDEARSLGLNSVLKFSLYIMLQLLEGEKFQGSALRLDFLDKLKRDEFDFSGVISSNDDSGLMPLRT